MIVGMGLALGWDSDLGRGQTNGDLLSNICRWDSPWAGTTWGEDRQTKVSFQIFVEWGLAWAPGLGQRTGETQGKQGISFQIIVGMGLALGWDSYLGRGWATKGFPFK